MDSSNAKPHLFRLEWSQTNAAGAENAKEWLKVWTPRRSCLPRRGESSPPSKNRWRTLSPWVRRQTRGQKSHICLELPQYHRSNSSNHLCIHIIKMFYLIRISEITSYFSLRRENNWGTDGDETAYVWWVLLLPSVILGPERAADDWSPCIHSRLLNRASAGNVWGCTPNSAWWLPWPPLRFWHFECCQRYLSVLLSRR